MVSELSCVVALVKTLFPSPLGTLIACACTGRRDGLDAAALAVTASETNIFDTLTCPLAFDASFKAVLALTLPLVLPPVGINPARGMGESKCAAKTVSLCPCAASGATRTTAASLSLCGPFLVPQKVRWCGRQLWVGPAPPPSVSRVSSSRETALRKKAARCPDTRSYDVKSTNNCEG